MAVVSLEKIRVFTPIAEADVLLNIMQNAGCLEIISENSTTDNNDNPAYLHSLEISNQYARIEMARTFFTPHLETGFLKNALEDSRAYTSATELDSLAATTDLKPIIAMVEDFQFKLAELERNERTTNEALQTLHAWERFELPLNRITETTHTITFALRGPERLLNKTLTDIKAELDDLISIKTVSITTSLITLLKIHKSQVEEIISAGGVSIVKLPNTASTAATELKRLNQEHQAILVDRENLMTEIKSVAATHLPILKKMSDITRWETERARTVASLPKTDRITIVTAWAPKSQLPAMEADFTSKLETFALEIVDTTDTEVIPTEITNSNLIKPFETVTRLYGAPYYKDLDPTPVLSVFFFIFFGVCLSDAGYGLLLILMTGFVLLKYNIESGMKQLLTLLFYGGISTFITGIIFGGYFGINLTAIIESYPRLQFLLDLQKFDPINNPLPVFYLALALGFVHVAFGISLNFYRKVSLGETKDAWLDDAPWLYFFTVGALYIANMVGYLNETLSDLLTNYSSFVYSSAVALIILTQGRSQKTIIGKLIFGLLGLYGSVGYFADILSYSRLMALGLATGALAFSINSIAAFVGGDTLGIGTVFMVLVLILGHTLNIAISLMGTFINSARLQFVEFFSKFSTGSGRAFVPFKKETRHVIILPDPPSN